MLTVKSLIGFFSTYTLLPVKINDVRDHIIEHGGAEDIVFHDVSVDTDILQGLLFFTKHKPPYRSEEVRVAHIALPDCLSEPEKRLICAKELLHILDPDQARANTRSKVSSLLDDIIIPPELLLELNSANVVVLSDHTGLMLALALLFPRDAREVLLPYFRAGNLTVNEVAALANIPESYVNVIMSDTWGNFLDQFLR
jgi:hypothetical protein